MWLQNQQGASVHSSQPEDVEKANMRKQIEQLQAAAAQTQLQNSYQTAEQSGVTDEERLEAALQQQQLQARIDQLEVRSYTGKQQLLRDSELATCLETCTDDGVVWHGSHAALRVMCSRKKWAPTRHGSACRGDRRQLHC